MQLFLVSDFLRCSIYHLKFNIEMISGGWHKNRFFAGYESDNTKGCTGMHQYIDAGSIIWEDAHIFYNNLNSPGEYRDPFPDGQVLKILNLTFQNKRIGDWGCD